MAFFIKLKEVFIMETIKVFEEGSKEYNRLSAAKNLIESETKVSCIINEVYFDYSQDWLCTTLLAESEIGYYQALTPKQQEKIVYGEIDEWFNTIKEIIQGIKERC